MKNKSFIYPSLKVFQFLYPNYSQISITTVHFFNDYSPAFLVKRFDVLPDNTRYQQEDFAQIAQMSEETHEKNYKYDISYEEIALLLKKYASAYQIEVEKFFNLILFNYLINNGDAHLKNFSLYCNRLRNKTHLLTPAYDLLNTRLHIPHETAMALPLFKDDYQSESYKRNGFYVRDDFFEFGIKVGIPENRVNRFLDTIVAHESEIMYHHRCK